MTGFPPNLLTLTPAAGAVAVTRVLLGRAVEARRRLAAAADTEALHDFRVSLRRLRCCLRAYRPYLGGALPRKVRRQLRQIAADTNAARDAEVQLYWVRGREAQASRPERAGVNWFASQVEERLAAQQEAVREGARRFDRLARSIRARLRAVAHDAGAGDGSGWPPTFGAATGGLVLEHAAELGARLATVASVTDEEEAHLARIRAKRLRYLLEPVGLVRSDAQALVERLRALQDLLGELHDMHVVAADIAELLERAAVDSVRALRSAATAGQRGKTRNRRVQPGLLSLIRQSAARQRELFATLEAEWLGPSLGAFLEQAEAVGKALGATSTVPAEIERKFLLRGLPPVLEGAASVELKQGWLPGTVLQERLRSVTDGGSTRYYRTVKSGTGVTRIEIEEETSADLFDRLWPLTEGRRVVKRRYLRADNGLVWEVDVFTDRDLVLAEVELPAANMQVQLPDWLSEWVVREVTGEPEYVNVNLAR
ncbi:MAG TPA: CHAD domain-containing protein [Gemmatimonadales bacterium]|nr:CHAD domain-containing protein [Gemmatimonadales bacterium]